MEKIKNIALLALVILFLCLAAYYSGRLLGKSEAKQAGRTVVTARLILDKIQNQSFLVTKTLFLDTDVQITVKDASGWKGFFVGQKINAQGVVRVDVGSDLKKMSAEDIIVDHSNRSAIVYLPPAEILDSSLSGDVRIENKKGVWTNIRDFFNQDKSEDYNRAANELVSQANAAAKAKSDIFKEVDNSAVSFAVFVVSGLLPGYEVRVEQK